MKLALQVLLILAALSAANTARADCQSACSKATSNGGTFSCCAFQCQHSPLNEAQVNSCAKAPSKDFCHCVEQAAKNPNLTPPKIDNCTKAKLTSPKTWIFSYCIDSVGVDGGSSSGNSSESSSGPGAGGGL